MFDLERHLVAYPNAAVALDSKGRIFGCWQEGNSYARKTAFHGAYSPSYLAMVFSLIPHQTRLHVFAGSVKDNGALTIDLNPTCDPDIVADVTTYEFPLQFDLILADPPCRKSDAEIYGCKMPRTLKVLKNLRKAARPGWVLVWLDLNRPMFTKTDWKDAGCIAYLTSTNHIIRTVQFFEAV